VILTAAEHHFGYPSFQLESRGLKLDEGGKRMPQRKDRSITIEPRFLEPAILGKVRVVGEMTTLLLELLLQQALADWKRSH
jgi:hypothetical protein